MSEKEYLVAPRPDVRLACGNCGSKKIFKVQIEGAELEIAQCEDCSKLFAICPMCSIPAGLSNSNDFWKCPSCNINFTLVNDYLLGYGKNPSPVKYPLGNPEITYDTKVGVSMEEIELMPVGDSSLEIISEEVAPKVKKTRAKKNKEAIVVE